MGREVVEEVVQVEVEVEVERVFPSWTVRGLACSGVEAEGEIGHCSGGGE